MMDGLLGAWLVLVVDLWLLWIPAHLYATKEPTPDRVAARMARVINLLAGLLLMTPDNPIYHLLSFCGL